MTLFTKDKLDSILKEWIESYGDNINEFNNIQIQEYKYIWFVDEVLNITTYSIDISIEIGKLLTILCKNILVKQYKDKKRNLDERIQYDNKFNECHSMTNICLYLNLIIDYLDWGINIYNAWFDESKEFIINENKYKLNKLNLETLFLWIDGYESY